ncbi:GPP34 family phosphoprotein [Gordonia sp. SCSIO 19800]|uniref:GOLPH3/VPS74 family protein n=1 Tax=Gordonia sp. SCSIO 19800 TaxID=2826926 RepID=UPI001B8445D2|nr:GPP34 family phosphoprotein [Gordonia sp. SCSIO 19800]MBR7192561.1 GPP34 family phosphoprotein [Gordonia sp. SCSIO 19800]
MDTTPLIVEDLLLMLLDDESGAIAGEGTLFYPLGGAVLVELGLRGAVEIDEGGGGLTGARITAVPGNAPSDPLLAAAYRTIAERPRGVQALLPTIGADLRGTVVDRLLERGLIRKERRKLLGLFPTVRLLPGDAGYEETLQERVRAALVEGADPDARTAAVAALLSASGVLSHLHPTIPWSGDVYRHGKELEQGIWGAEAVNTAVVRTAAAIAASSVAVMVTVVGTT